MAVTYDKARKRWRATVGSDREGTRTRRWFERKSEATQFERDAKLSLESPHSRATSATRDPQYHTLGDVLDHIWRHSWSQGASAPSIRSGVAIVKAYFDGRPLSSITASDLEVFVTHERKRGMTPSTVNRRLSLISQALRWAEEHQLIYRAPRVRRQKELMPRDTWLEVSDVERLVDLARSWGRPEIADYIQLLAFTGMRMSEALTLKASDVDLERGMIRVRGTKTNRTRFVPIFPSARSMLEKRTEGLKPADLLFGFSYNSFENTWARLREVMGWSNDPQKVPYILRHTFASLAVQNGMPLDRVSRILGHTTLNMTMRYAKLAPEHLNGEVDPF